MDCYSLPTEIEIDGKTHPISKNGDFRMVFDCFALLNDEDIPERFRPYFCLIIFYEDINSYEDVEKLDDPNKAVEKMYEFFNCNQPEFGVKVHYNLIDWEMDSQLICAAANVVARTEIRSEPYLHWFTFCGYLSSAPQDATWTTVINLRYKKASGKKIEKYERDFMRENPQYFTTKEDKEIEADFNEWLKENGINRM